MFPWGSEGLKPFNRPLVDVTHQFRFQGSNLGFLMETDFLKCSLSLYWLFKKDSFLGFWSLKPWKQQKLSLGKQRGLGELYLQLGKKNIFLLSPTKTLLNGSMCGLWDPRGVFSLFSTELISHKYTLKSRQDLYQVHLSHEKINLNRQKLN